MIGQQRRLLPRSRVNLAVLTDQDSEGKEPSLVITVGHEPTAHND